MEHKAKQRLAMVSEHLGTSTTTIDTQLLQHIFEHDNWETRARLKELMKDELYVPYVPTPRDDHFLALAVRSLNV